MASPLQVSNGKTQLTTETPAATYGGRVDDGVVRDDRASKPHDASGHVLSGGIPAYGNGKGRGDAAVGFGYDPGARKNTGAGAVA